MKSSYSNDLWRSKDYLLPYDSLILGFINLSVRQSHRKVKITFILITSQAAMIDGQIHHAEGGNEKYWDEITSRSYTRAGETESIRIRVLGIQFTILR